MARPALHPSTHYLGSSFAHAVGAWFSSAARRRTYHARFREQLGLSGRNGRVRSGAAVDRRHGARLGFSLHQRRSQRVRSCYSGSDRAPRHALSPDGLRVARRPPRHGELSAFRRHSGQPDRFWRRLRDLARLRQARSSLPAGRRVGRRAPAATGLDRLCADPDPYRHQLCGLLPRQYRAAVPGFADRHRLGVGRVGPAHFYSAPPPYDCRCRQRDRLRDGSRGLEPRHRHCRRHIDLKESRPMSATVRNVAREKLEQGQLSLGVGVRPTRSVEIAKAMAVAGFDWLFLDMEHGVMSLEACAQISIAALDAGIAPIARVPNGEYAIATRALDNGALGIVMPHVDTAAEAREVVNRLKYPPVGHRSMGGIGPHYGLRSASSGEAAAALNAANLTIVMLETPTAIANAEVIAAVPGIDVLLIGTNDLCAEMSIHGDFGNERVARHTGR